MMHRFAALVATSLLAACGGGGAREAPAQIALYSPDYPRIAVVASPHAVTSPDGLVWHAGALYIADEGGSAVRRLDGGRVTTLADASAGLKSPEDLRFSAAGALFVTDDSAGHVWRIAPGTPGARAVGGFARPAEMEGIAEGSAGGVLVGDGAGGQVYRLAEDGAAAPMPGGQWRVAKPESMARAPDGSLTLADNRADRLYSYDAAGQRHEIPLPAGLSPESIAYSGADLWITDSHNGRLYRMRPNQPAETVALFSGDWININGIAAAPDGTIYISIQTDLAARRGVIVALAPAKSR